MSLTKEDIEDLGYTLTNDNYGSRAENSIMYLKSVKSIGDRVSDWGLKCLIHHNHTTGWTYIEAGMFNSFGGAYKFVGRLKNKEELIKIIELTEIK